MSTVEDNAAALHTGGTTALTASGWVLNGRMSIQLNTVRCTTNLYVCRVPNGTTFTSMPRVSEDVHYWKKGTADHGRLGRPQPWDVKPNQMPRAWPGCNDPLHTYLTIP